MQWGIIALRENILVIKLLFRMMGPSTLFLLDLKSLKL